MKSSDIVAELWRRIQARDWDRVGELLAEDFVLEWPNAQIRLRGARISSRSIAAIRKAGRSRCSGLLPRETTAVSEVRVPHPTVGPYHALSFFEVEDGQLVRGREYWVEERYEEPAPERARWFEPM